MLDPDPMTTRSAPVDEEPADDSAISRMLEQCRRHIDRVQPEDLEQVMAGGALVVDVRPSEQRRAYGELPGALVIDRNVLEWRLDPTSPWRWPGSDDPDRRIVIVCQQGYSSTLAAYTLHELGLSRVADLAGGYEAWSAQQVPGRS
jgi:rhodanese-related sulfurtransferase